MEKILVILLATFIGYSTNWLAIKMLFRPYTRKTIFKIHIPFTPGIIPKNRHNIARSLANIMTDKVLTDDTISSKIIDNLKIEGNISSLIDENCEESIKNTLKKVSKNISDDLLNSGLSENIVESLFNEIKPKLGFFGGMIDGFRDVIIDKIDNYISTEGKTYIENYLNKKYDEIKEVNFASLKENPLFDIVKNALGSFLNQAIMAVDIKGLIEDEINALDIKEFERMLTSVLNRELRAITWLGAIIGAIIGCINLFFL